MQGHRSGNIVLRAIQASKEEGISIVFRYIGKHYFRQYSELIFYKVFKSRRRFVIDGRSYSYRYAAYNNTWRNERAIELPFIYSIVQDFNDHNILEVGNVLSYYYPVTHDILDKYELGKNIINTDVINFKSKKPYDLIICISTLEHIGKDHGESVDGEKVLAAFRNLQQMNARKLVVTVPLGYNDSLDRYIKDRQICFTKIIYMRRTSQDNHWEQISDISDVDVSSPYPNTNVLLIGI